MAPLKGSILQTVFHHWVSEFMWAATMATNIEREDKRHMEESAADTRAKTASQKQPRHHNINIGQSHTNTAWI